MGMDFAQMEALLRAQAEAQMEAQAEFNRMRQAERNYSNNPFAQQAAPRETSRFDGPAVIELVQAADGSYYVPLALEAQVRKLF